MKTSLYNQHIKLEAKIVDFAGYQMPINYPQGINLESKAVREFAGVFDVSHMGQIYIEGNNALEFVDYITTNNVSKLSVGQCQYSLLCNERGGIIDDLILYCLEDGYMLVVNAANIEKDFDWIQSHKPKDVLINNLSDKISLIALQGPKSREILSNFSNLREALLDLKFYHFSRIDNKKKFNIISRTGYTGELGYEIYADHDFINDIWSKLINDYSVPAIGLAARDILRMEMRYLLYGNDMDDEITPFHCGLGWVVNENKKDFIGKEELIKKKNNLDKRMIGFSMQDKCVPRKGYELFNNDKKIGYVTSGTFSPNLNKGIGMGYIDNNSLGNGTIFLKIRDKNFPAVISKGPFVEETSIFE